MNREITNIEINKLKYTIKNFGNDYTSSIQFENKNSPNPTDIFIIGNGIQGDIAGIKRLINKKNDWVYSSRDHTDIIDNYDKLGLSVMDFINYDRLGENLYNNNEVLANAVYDVLYDNNIETKFKTVKTLNLTSYGKHTQLRTKNLNIDYSEGFNDAFNLNKSPVVMAGGIYSNIDAFDEFGRELVQNGQDVWLIEITGGPDSEDNTSYTYQDLENYFIPSLLAGVQYYSGKDKLNYVGHSNGCRSALTSLSKHYRGVDNVGYVLEYGEWVLMDLVANPVDKFFGIACPTTLNDLSGTSEVQREKDDLGEYESVTAINNLRNNTNIFRYQFASELNKLANVEFFLTNYKISLNLQEFYNDLSIDESSSFSGNQNAANEFNFFAGTGKYPWYYFLNHYGGDGTVPLQDINLLNNNFQNSQMYEFDENHGDILNNNNMKNLIIGGLN
ncbi:MAG: hypothetical protein HRU03_08545 [Nanoarchaeales archaeon]|nr:hypothetical protein [Nanoarchaeales archaeon]